MSNPEAERIDVINQTGSPAMNCRRRVPLFVSVTTLLGAAVVFGADDRSWVGKQVIIKKQGATLQQRDGTEGTVVEVAVTDIVLKVLEDDGKEIRVRQINDKAGWIARSEVVPLSKAVVFFTDRIRANKKDIIAYAFRGAAYIYLGKLDEALADACEVIKREPSQPIWFLNRGMLYSRRKEFDKAIADFSETIRLQPRLAIAFRNRGSAHRSKGDADKAIADYGQALRLDPQDALRSRETIIWSIS